MNTITHDGTHARLFRALSSVAALGVCFALTGCQGEQSSGSFTATEKKAMTTKSEPPKEAMEARTRTGNAPPTGSETSPWSKPVGK